jgi:hypothetical protein
VLENVTPPPPKKKDQNYFLQSGQYLYLTKKPKDPQFLPLKKQNGMGKFWNKTDAHCANNCFFKKSIK